MRRVSPYRGVEQIVESGQGRAVSVDGRNWEIQLLAAHPAGWGSLNRTPVMDYARYAAWSADEGLARFPRFPVTDFDPGPTAQGLLVAIASLAEMLPFALADEYECWQCADGRPVALVATSVRPPERRAVAHWRAPPEDPQASDLEACVRRRCNHTSWFRRGADGRGERIAAPAVDASAAEILSANRFPECLLAVDAFVRAEDQSLVASHVERQASRLLMLPLAAGTRAALERAAIADAPGVAKFWRLYPAVADPTLITRLRVEARLRAAA